MFTMASCWARRSMLLGSASYLRSYQSPFDRLRVTTTDSAITIHLDIVIV
jgi:hypothetical protein